MSSDPNRQPSPYSHQRGTTTEQTSIEGSGSPASSQSAGQSSEVTKLIGSAERPTPPEAVPWVPSPAVDLIENTDELWLFIDLPGFQSDEIELEGDARTIRVSASRPSEIEESRNVLVHERTVQVERTIQLPAPADIDEVDAIFEQGVCKVTIPKAASERYRDIDLRNAE